jgi:TPP-dependent trihydroxycyclohexane-1,2-dione (THcHDO) dehydratase
MYTFTIELRGDFDEEKIEIIKEAAKIAAKHLYTTAALISDKRKPQIVLHGGDFFTKAEEIMLADDI